MKIYNQLVLLSIFSMMSMTTAIKNPYHILTNRLLSGKSEDPKPFLGESLVKAYEKLVAERRNIFSNLAEENNQTSEIENNLIQLEKVNKKEEQLDRLTFLLNDEKERLWESNDRSKKRNTLLQRLKSAFHARGDIPPEILGRVLETSDGLNRIYRSSIQKKNRQALDSMKLVRDDLQRVRDPHWFFNSSFEERRILKNTYVKNVKERMKILDKLNPSNVETLSQDNIDYNLQELKNLDIEENKIYTSLQKYLFPPLIQVFFHEKISRIKKFREILLNTFAELIKNQTNKEEYIQEYNKYLEISKSLDEALENVVENCIEVRI